MTKKITTAGFLDALGTIIYISLVAALLNNGEKLFGSKEDTIFIAISMLSLLVLSAAVVGSLIFGRPLVWYLNGQKSEGLKLLFYTLGWLFVFTVLFFAMMILINK